MNRNTQFIRKSYVSSTLTYTSGDNPLASEFHDVAHGLILRNEELKKWVFIDFQKQDKQYQDSNAVLR